MEYLLILLLVASTLATYPIGYTKRYHFQKHFETNLGAIWKSSHVEVDTRVIDSYRGRARTTYLLVKPISITVSPVGACTNTAHQTLNYQFDRTVSTTVTKSQSTTDKSHWKSATEIGLKLSASVEMFGFKTELTGSLKETLDFGGENCKTSGRTDSTTVTDKSSIQSTIPAHSTASLHQTKYELAYYECVAEVCSYPDREYNPYPNGIPAPLPPWSSSTEARCDYMYSVKENTQFFQFSISRLSRRSSIDSSDGNCNKNTYSLYIYFRYNNEGCLLLGRFMKF